MAQTDQPCYCAAFGGRAHSYSHHSYCSCHRTPQHLVGHHYAEPSPNLQQNQYTQTNQPGNVQPAAHPSQPNQLPSTNLSARHPSAPAGATKPSQSYSARIGSQQKAHPPVNELKRPFEVLRQLTESEGDSSWTSNRISKWEEKVHLKPRGRRNELDGMDKWRDEWAAIEVYFRMIKEWAHSQRLWIDVVDAGGSVAALYYLRTMSRNINVWLVLIGVYDYKNRRIKNERKAWAEAQRYATHKTGLNIEKYRSRDNGVRKVEEKLCSTADRPLWTGSKSKNASRDFRIRLASLNFLLLVCILDIVEDQTERVSPSFDPAVTYLQRSMKRWAKQQPPDIHWDEYGMLKRGKVHDVDGEDVKRWLAGWGLDFDDKSIRRAFNLVLEGQSDKYDGESSASDHSEETYVRIMGQERR